MADTMLWRVLFVDDEEETCRQVKEFLEGESITAAEGTPIVETTTDFTQALTLLEFKRFDLVILDVRLGASIEATQQEEIGRKTLEAIRQRIFIPVVFYTALPRLVRDLASPVIRIVEKTERFSKLLEEVKSIFLTRLPQMNRALLHHVEAIQRDYMWDFVAKSWDSFGNTDDHASLAYLLARRLALSLSDSGIQQLAKDLGGDSSRGIVEGKVHPMQYYVMPPVEASPLTGDIYNGQIDQIESYWVLLTPSCDMVVGREKAENLLFARCLLLSEQSEYHGWLQGLPKPNLDVVEALKSLLRNNRKKFQPERFFYLPNALALPDLLADFQQLKVLPREQLSILKRFSSLDSPFAEALTSRFARYFGRLGTPDLDIDYVFEKLTSESKDSSA